MSKVSTRIGILMRGNPLSPYRQSSRGHVPVVGEARGKSGQSKPLHFLYLLLGFKLSTHYSHMQGKHVEMDP